jgi:deazaflavin-dependent oxidoreductase (nitroreductase family)
MAAPYASRVPRVYGVDVPTWLTTALVAPLVRLGIGPRHFHLLSVPGRRTGRVYRTPVSVVERDGRRWLVAPYGEREWVKNARAAGVVELRRGPRMEQVRVKEVPPADRARILRAYLSQVPFTREFFDAEPGAPEVEFAAEAARHPVFAIVSDEGSGLRDDSRY